MILVYFDYNKAKENLDRINKNYDLPIFLPNGYECTTWSEVYRAIDNQKIWWLIKPKNFNYKTIEQAMQGVTYDGEQLYPDPSWLPKEE